MSGKWREMDTAPKDRQILLDVGLPWPVVGAYHSLYDEWTFAGFNIGLCKGEYVDVYFVTEYEKAPKFWQELPKLRGQE